MDLNFTILQNHMDIFVESRLASARYHQSGKPSLIVTLIGGLAARFERVAVRIERWANGSSDQSVDSLQILGGVR